MSSKPVQAIYFDSLAELLTWYDDLSKEVDSGQTRLDRFRRCSEDYDAYQIEGIDTEEPVKSLKMKREFPNNSSASLAPSLHSHSIISIPPYSSFLRPRFRSVSNQSTSSMRALSRYPSAKTISNHEIGNGYLKENIHRPKVMVCHDFRNGYQDGQDQSTIGYYSHKTGQRYFIQYPQLLESFIYFSHHRISIPPVSWINVCHRNCIKCFGTIIFESTGFLTDLDRLVSKARDGQFIYVDILVSLVERFGFDGFLFNIEARFSNEEISALFIPFIECLKSRLHTLHKKNEVIIYDSFLCPQNKVNYENGVTKFNYNLFSVSDRFFTNYWWSVKHLQSNLRNAGNIGVLRKLFTGNDVWGRGNTIGRGGFDTGSACQLISKYQSNIALFAPAWTYEQLGARNFSTNDTRFWIGLFDGELSVMSSVKPRNCPVFKLNHSSFIFYTDFSNGQGTNFFCKGIRVSNRPWVDGSLQLYLPLTVYRNQGLGLQMSLETLECFHGGSSLKVCYTPYIEEKRNGFPGYKIFSEQQVRDLQLFELNRTCQFNTVGVRVSYKLEQGTEEIFKLKIRYHTQLGHGVKTKTIRKGVMVIPFCSTKERWFTLDNVFSINVGIRETLVLETVEISYDKHNLGLRVHHKKSPSFSYKSYVVEDSIVTSVIDDEPYEKILDNDKIYDNDEDEGWVLVPRGIPGADTLSTTNNSVPRSMNPEIKIGEIAIINSNNYPNKNFFGIQGVRKVRKLATDVDGDLLVWSESSTNFVLYYVIYINDKFQGTSKIAQFFSEFAGRSDTTSSITSELCDKNLEDFEKSKTRKTSGAIIKVRVDIVDRLGVVHVGADLYI